MKHEGSKFGDFLTGILLGGLAGYVFALLNAPRPGDETRQILAERGRELREKARYSLQETVDKTGKLVAEGRERVAETVDDTLNVARERAVEVQDRGSSVIHDVREQASETLRRTADKVDPDNPTGGQQI